jgi:hypothetical protein
MASPCMRGCLSTGRSSSECNAICNTFGLNGSSCYEDCRADCRARDENRNCLHHCTRVCRSPQHPSNRAKFQRAVVANTRFGSQRNLTAPISCQAACYNLDTGADQRESCLAGCGRPTFPDHERNSYAQGKACVRLCAGANSGVIDRCFDNCLNRD